MGARKGVFLAAAVVALWTAAPASAVFHLMSIREVSAGGASPGAEFVELQMYAPGQNLVGGHAVTFYGPTGTATGSCGFPGNVANGENQRSILVATPSVGVASDCPLADGDRLNPAGGAVCFESIDCVAWGSFSGSVLSPVGAPAPTITGGMTLTRSIAPGCSTLLEPGDDTNNSAADLALTAPSPRNNATAPTETACGGGGGGGGGGSGGGDADPPETRITKGPDKSTNKRKVKIKFESNEPGSTFMCRLDKGAFKACDSPFKKRVGQGRHKFFVYAIDAAGNSDQTPAKLKFKVVGD
jgi:hypothetical protein